MDRMNQPGTRVTPAVPLSVTPATTQSGTASPAVDAPSARPANAGAVTPNTAAVGKAGNRRTYTVAHGDSLWRIAEKIYGNGVDYQKIATANNLPDPDRIRAGQCLVIPD